MKRKTSSLPTRVYKFHLGQPMGETMVAVDQAFDGARIHYNKLITIERVRRDRYRRIRSAMFPELATLESEYAQAQAICDALAKDIADRKARTKSRTVDATAKTALTEARAARKEVLGRLRLVRTAADESAELKSAAVAIDEAAKKAVKKLRKETYWGTYLLVEADAQRAKSDARGEPEYNVEPPHLCKSRIGVHFNGGIGADELATSTLLQIVPLDREASPEHPIVKKRRDKEKLLRFRIGSTDDKRPIWAEFPLFLHRPIPGDARIKDAFVTRKAHNVTMPWQYHLCLVLEAASLIPVRAPGSASATSAINFGWRSIDGELRVATIKGDAGVSEIRLPRDILGRMAKSEELRGLCDDKFNVAKAALATWLDANECPDGFRESFAHVGQWKSQHRMMELVWYWRENRFSGDDAIFAEMDEWRKRYRHLMKWAQDEHDYCLRWRDNHYSVEAKKLATSNARIVLDTFKIATVAKRGRVEEQERGGQSARHNRVLAASSALREKLVKACAKYGCEVVAADAANGTKRCNGCGDLQVVKSLDHRCTACGREWDQDHNNTSNLLSANASGEVVTIVCSREVAKNGEIVVPQMATLGAARKALGKSARRL
jgi:hypothetical protein